MSFKRFDADARALVVCAMNVASNDVGITPQDFLSACDLLRDDFPCRVEHVPFTSEAKKGMELSLRNALRREHEFIMRDDVLDAMQQVIDA